MDGTHSQSGYKFIVWNLAGFVLLCGICHQFCSYLYRANYFLLEFYLFFYSILIGFQIYTFYNFRYFIKSLKVWKKSMYNFGINKCLRIYSWILELHLKLNVGLFFSGTKKHSEILRSCLRKVDIIKIFLTKWRKKFVLI